jgi:probable rRNA maturation factor
LDCPDGELSILIVDDTQIELLNRKYFHRHGATNVIAFPMRSDQFPDIQPDLIGDVVISIETAAREGAGAGISTERRFTQLLIHGILHLFGYDHEKTAQEAKIMAQKSEKLLNLIDK